MTVDYTARDEGVERNLGAAEGTPYKILAEQAIEQLIEMGRPFSADEVRSLIPSTEVPHHPNVLPSLFSRYAKSGRIVRVGEVRSNRGSRHGSPNKLWIAAGAGARVDLEAENARLRRDLEQAGQDIELLLDALARLDETIAKWEKNPHISGPVVRAVVAQLREILPSTRGET